MSGEESNHHRTGTKRLLTDYMQLKKEPLPYILAEPLPTDIFQWHYVFRGPEKTPYEGGYYHGMMKFPKEYPFKGPKIVMLTPSGRFETNKNLCLSVTDVHPELWNPAWSAGSILNALLSFMLEEAKTSGTILRTSEAERKSLASASLQFNMRNKTFVQLFSQAVKKMQKVEEKREKCTDGPCSSSSLKKL